MSAEGLNSVLTLCSPTDLMSGSCIVSIIKKLVAGPRLERGYQDYETCILPLNYPAGFRCFPGCHAVVYPFYRVSRLLTQQARWNRTIAVPETGIEPVRVESEHRREELFAHSILTAPVGCVYQFRHSGIYHAKVECLSNSASISNLL